MADHPEAKQSTTGDRTSALVAGGLALLAVVGVATVFSETLAAAWSPASSAPAPAEPATGPASPSPPSGGGAPPAGADGSAAPP
ncbi:MAG TPA: hypothetical protein VFH68_07910 [Polyangia bacterium]|jgi:hypothetical protein|nr:hypothetical protein [Polyangia bacterium]